MEYITSEKTTNRKLSILKLNEIPSIIEFTTQKFYVVFLVDNLPTLDTDNISKFLKKLIDTGMVYLCTWGKHCEQIHDITDQILTLPENQYDKNLHIMTTWHNDETLADALWFSIYNSMPDDAFFDDTRDFIAITINDDKSYDIIKKYMGDLESLKADVL